MRQRQHTLIDPFELRSPGGYRPPAPRAPMPTLSIDVEFEWDLLPRTEEQSGIALIDHGGRIRHWCSDDE